MTGRGLRTLGLLVTRAVLLVALCGLALSLVGSLSVHHRQYFGAAECGPAVWDVGIGGGSEVWSVAEAATTGRLARPGVRGGGFHAPGDRGQRVR
ncbi:hypothetical protein, partial [Streptomyces sp. NPDC052127]|uniref:hypothetical protein n=1 Tax=Streptomyces sp. NPDC052127 TaxID=3155679 RepID=UPI00343F5E58